MSERPPEEGHVPLLMNTQLSSMMGAIANYVVENHGARPISLMPIPTSHADGYLPERRSQGMESTPPLPEREAGEKPISYIRRVAALTPEEEGKLAEGLDTWSNEFQQLYFDDATEQQNAAKGRQFVSWIYTGKPGDEPPESLRLDVSRGDFKKYQTKRSDYSYKIQQAVYIHAARPRQLLSGHEEELGEVVAEHLRESRAYTFLQSFNDQKVGFEERPLSHVEKLVRRQQSVGALASKYGLTPKEVELPREAVRVTTDRKRPLRAMLARRELDRSVYALDQDTSLRLVRTPVSSEDAIARLKNYLLNKIATIHNEKVPGSPIKSSELNFEDSYLYAKAPDGTLVEGMKILTHIACKASGSLYDDPSNRLLTRVFQDVLIGEPERHDTYDSLVEAATEKTGRKTVEDIVDAYESPWINALQSLVWLRKPEVPTETNEESMWSYPPRTPSQGMASREAFERQSADVVGNVLLDHRTPEEQAAYTTRMLMSVPKGMIRPAVKDATTALRIRLDHRAIDEQSEPYIVGYALTGIKTDGTSFYYDFARADEDDPHRPCTVSLNVYQRGKLIQHYNREGYTAIAAELQKIPDFIVGDLPKGIGDASEYYVPEAATRSVELKDGVAFMQCVGADELTRLGIDAVWPGQSRPIKGRAISNSGSIRFIAHRQTLFTHQGNRYVLDATPAANGSVVPPANTSQQGSGAADASAAEQAAPVSLANKQDEKTGVTSPKSEITPEERSRTYMNAALLALTSAREAFETASLLRLNLEKQFKPNLYKELVKVAPKASDPLRQTTQHVLATTAEHFDAEDLDAVQQRLERVGNTLKYIQNLMQLPVNDRTKYGAHIPDSALTSYRQTLREVETALWQMQLAHKARTMTAQEWRTHLREQLSRY